MTGRIPLEPSATALPREVVLASAGTGKTFTLSSRIMGLLARGIPPERILATTFTRKAAGEILNRVLLRLAGIVLGDSAEMELARDVLLDPCSAPEEPLLIDLFSGVLERVVRDLHRFNVGTLDAFFLRIAGSFPGEMGMPTRWSVSHEPMARAVESEALQTILAGAGAGEMVELVRMTMRGESGRGVHRRVLAQLTELRELLHQRGIQDPATLWDPPAPLSPPGDRELPSWRDIGATLRTAPLPQTKKGDPDRRFANAVEAGAQALEEEDWDAFCGRGLGKVVLAGESTFSGKEIPGELHRAVHLALAGVAAARAPELQGQARALRSLVTAYDGALSFLQRREGAYRFQDITFLLGGMNPVATRGDLWYRLDQRTHHLLLDEFQDTSRAQWEALEPLASELLAGHRDERSVVIVADPKQSIYGWRGAEPDLVHRVAEGYALQRGHLDHSYRSSQQVLELVNRVFTELPANPVWDREPGLREAARRWAKGFREHRAARELAGYVVLRVGPRDERMDRSDRPGMMAWAAERIRELHHRHPRHTIGVLVRRNATVARLVRDLNLLDVPASEEGSSSIADSPAVSTVLALLRLADHPGDTLAAYQVASSPLGNVVGLTDHEDGGTRLTVSLSVRRTLLNRGYGATLNAWVRALAPLGVLDSRDMSRLLQLVELAHRWEERATLRPEDFVRFVRAESMDAPSGSLLRVMTVHQAKGLEFDLVVLPELDLRMTRGQGRFRSVVPLRDPETGQVLRIYPRLPKPVRALFPEVESATRQDLEGELQDALGILYVALTRARHALHLFCAEDPPEPPKQPPFTYAGLLRYALGVGGTPAREGDLLVEEGNRDWRRTEAADGGKPLEPAAPARARTEGAEDAGAGPETPLLRLTASQRRTRSLPHRSPSSHDSGGRIDLRRLLTLSGREGRRRGSVVHRWLERMEWLDQWKPSQEEFLRLGRETDPGLSDEEIRALAKEFLEWLQAPEIRQELCRDRVSQGSEVRNELPFALILDGSLVQGRMDRVVLMKEGEALSGVQVLDYKTDIFPSDEEGALEETAAGYRNQMETYQRAAARLFDLPPSDVQVTLLFLAAGRAVSL